MLKNLSYRKLRFRKRGALPCLVLKKYGAGLIALVAGFLFKMTTLLFNTNENALEKAYTGIRKS
jgi:hypothetical protein